MSSEIPSHLPVPDRAAVKAWLTGLNLPYLHEQGWNEVNAHEHEIAMASRTFANRAYPSMPDRRGDFLDGVTFGILSLLHAASVDELNHLLQSEVGEPETAAPTTSEAAA